MTGENFNPARKYMFKHMLKSELLQWSLNKTPLWNISKRNWLIKKLLGSIDGNAYAVQIPFHVAYGRNIHIGKNFFANYNCVMMDHAPITIGDNVFLGPNVSIITVNHPLSPAQRRIFYTKDSFHPEKKSDNEIISPVTIGDDVWIGAGAIICPGVTIGAGTTIGAGSVVTHDIPENVLAVGNPCHIIRKIN